MTGHSFRVIFTSALAPETEILGGVPRSTKERPFSPESIQPLSLAALAS
jgi:hypothetical protein